MQHNLLRLIATFLTLSMLPFQAHAAAPAQFGRDSLVGKWKATLSTDDGKESTDNITFKGGKFTSENQQKDGFEPATYDDKPAPAGMSAEFDVTLTNKAGDTAKWSGFSTGSEITGTLVITKKDGTTTSYHVMAAK